MCMDPSLKDAYHRLGRLEVLSKCGALVAFMSAQNGLRRCTRSVIVTTKRNASAVIDLNVSDWLRNKTLQ